MDTNILVIGTTASGSGGMDISHLVSYVVQYPKLWSSDSGRNMKGDMKATLVGVYTKLQVELLPGYYGDSAISDMLDILNGGSVYVKYYDIQTMSTQVESFYFGDIETKLLQVQQGGNKVVVGGFSIIGNSRRNF